MSTLWTTYAAALVVMSLVTFTLYGWDKRQACLGRWRVAESTLHTLALLGGFPGALLARRVFTHKTRKPLFTCVLWLIALGHVIVLLAIYQVR